MLVRCSRKTVVAIATPLPFDDLSKLKSSYNLLFQKRRTNIEQIIVLSTLVLKKRIDRRTRPQKYLNKEFGVEKKNNQSIE